MLLYESTVYLKIQNGVAGGELRAANVKYRTASDSERDERRRNKTKKAQSA
jgi:hypothetical protein